MDKRNYRLIDYLLKGMSMDEKRKMDEALILTGDKVRRDFIIRPDYYKQKYGESFYNYYLNSGDIFKNAYEKANEICIINGFRPLFPNINDIKEMVLLHDQLLESHTEEECNKTLGCTSYDDYVPEKYVKPEDKKKEF